MIRPIELQDAEKIADICRDTLGHDVSVSTLLKRIPELKDDSAYFIRVSCDEHSGNVNGFIQAQKYDLLYGNSGFNIIALAVQSSAQKKGLGKELVKTLELYAVKNGASFIRLNSRIERTDAHRFYLHLGYQCDKTQKRFIKEL